ncbi:MAG: TonB-dependent receptor [Bryobacterales bacterium]|nr:TonB-dependent receptor [Bryobacterales bacterium]
MYCSQPPSRSLFLLVVFVIATSLCGTAQSISASLSGMVVDSSQAAVEGASILLRNRGTGEEMRASTDMSGRYRILRVPPGSYELTIAAPGLGEQRVPVIVLVAGESRRQDATLLVAGATPIAIEVVGSLVSTDTSQASSAFTQRQMEQLPMSLGIQGRNFRNQMFLAPGVAPTTQPHRPFAVAGARTRNNNFLIDSNDFNEIQGGLLPGRGPSEQMIPSESIESMQVLTHNFKAEYGRQNGSVVNVISRSGGSVWRGAAYHFLQHDLLSARNTFDAEKPPVRYNQPGVRIGGPLVRERLFVFGNYEAVIRRTASPLTVRTLTNAQRERAEPAVRPLVALFPEPNLPGTNLYRANLNQVSDTHTFLARADYHASETQRWFARSSYLRSTDDRGFLASRARANTISGPQAHSLHHVLTPSATLVNEARVNFTRFAVDDQFGESPFLGDPAVNGEIGFLIVNGLTSAGYPRFLGRVTAQNNFQFTDDLTVQRGSHTLKAGLALRRIQFNNGTFNTLFLGQLRFNNIDQFLAARPAAYSRNVGNPYIGLRGSEWNAYLQDDWQVSSRLTLNLGLRYEYNSVPAEVNGLIASQYRFRPDRNNFAPRAGLAWRLTENGATVLRAGYGIYYNVLEWDFIGLTRFNPPLVDSLAANNPGFPNLLASAQVQIPSGLVIPDEHMRQPYAQHLQLAIERQLGRRLTASIGYLGTVALKLPRASQPNGGDGLAQAQRPNPAVGVITRLETAANSNYHGMVSSAAWRGEGLLLTGAYTWAKSIDQVSDIPNSNLQLPANVLPLDANNWALNRGPADTDIRHVATFSYVWDVPVFSRQRWMGGWQLTGAVYSRGGVPVTLLSGTDSPMGVNTNRILAIPGTLAATGDSKQPFSLADGVSRNALTPAPGTFGTIGRNTHRSGGLVQWNAGLQKRFQLWERVAVQARVEGFNLLNRANYDVPDAVLTSPTFGAATAAFDSRQGQVGLRFEF